MPSPFNYDTAQTPDFNAIVHNALMEPIQRAQLQMQLGQQQAQFQQAQQVQAAKQAYITNPNAQNLNALITLDPQSAAAIKTGHDALDSESQKGQLRQATYIRSLIASGKPDQAADALQQRISADAAAGQDTTSDQQMLDLIHADPAKAGAAIDYHLAAILGPDKWAENFNSLGSNARENAEEPGKLAQQPVTLAKTQADTALANAQTNNLTNPRPETASAGIDPVTGQPIFYNKNAPPPTGLSSAGAPGLQGFVTQIQADENSTGNPSATTQIKGANGKPTTTAMGNGQFLKGTFVPIFRQLHPELAEGKTDDQIAAYRANPQYSTEATTAYAQQNAATFQQAGLPVNGTTLAMGQKLGPGGAQAVLNADPSAPLAKVLPADVIKANPQLAKLTAGQYAQGLAQKFGVAPIVADASQAGSLTGDDYLKTLPPQRQNLIKAIADGRLAAPNPGSRSPGAMQLLNQVTQYDPTFDAANAKTRQATRVSFTSGHDATQLATLNTAVNHLASLDASIDGLNNNGLPINNTLAHGIAGITGTDARIKTFNFTKKAALDELNKLFVGAAGTGGDREYWSKQLDAASSPDTLHAVIAQAADLIRGRIDALGEKYNQGMGKSVDGISLMTPEAQRNFLTLGHSQAEKAARTPNSQAVIALRQNPKLATAFDQKYGPGASSAYLGRQELAQ